MAINSCLTGVASTLTWCGILAVNSKFRFHLACRSSGKEFKCTRSFDRGNLEMSTLDLQVHPFNSISAEKIHQVHIRIYSCPTNKSRERASFCNSLRNQSLQCFLCGCLARPTLQLLQLGQFGVAPYSRASSHLIWKSLGTFSRTSW